MMLKYTFYIIRGKIKYIDSIINQVIFQTIRCFTSDDSLYLYIITFYTGHIYTSMMFLSLSNSHLE